MRAHLPPSTATLFAKPEIKSDRVTVEWYSELEGQPYLDNLKMNRVKLHYKKSLLLPIMLSNNGLIHWRLKQKVQETVDMLVQKLNNR